MLKKEIKINNHELDLFYLLSILYKNFILFIIISLSPIIISALYFINTEDKFTYVINFDQNYIDPDHSSIKCLYNDNEAPCRYDLYLNKLLLEYDKSFNYRINKNTLFFEGINTFEEFEKLYNFLLVSNENNSRLLFERSKKNIDLINQIVIDKKYNFDNENFYISKLYNFNLLIDKYESGENIFEFGNYASEKQKSFSTSFLLMLILFSPIASCAVIYIKENKNLIKKI